MKEQNEEIQKEKNDIVKKFEDVTDKVNKEMEILKVNFLPKHGFITKIQKLLNKHGVI